MINEKPLSTKERNSLDDREFGIPELRAYPLNDVSHVEQAVRMFNHVDPEYEKELADNLNKAIKKFGLHINVGNGNRFKKYVKEGRIMSRENGIANILEGLELRETQKQDREDALFKYLKSNLKGFNFNKFTFDGKFWSYSILSDAINVVNYNKGGKFDFSKLVELGYTSKMCKDSFKEFSRDCYKRLSDAEKELEYLLSVLSGAKDFLADNGFDIGNLKNY